MSKPPSAAGSRKRELFLKALQLQDSQARAAFLDGACGADTELRTAVEVLLRSHQDDSFLEHPAAMVDPGPAPATAPITEKPGDAIGRYKLLEKLGEGGFGVVYMAEQREPVKRRVALKIIKVGMDTREVVARFEAERQALALMDHPNIAKVLDGGATEHPLTPSLSPNGGEGARRAGDAASSPSPLKGERGEAVREGLPAGRPYFVMELVRGIKITEYCDQNQLGLEERLKLFMQVCHAVQHAHQKGIIHRDLKPSNILVTLHDGVPVPKVIDFGIAKATQQELTEKTLFTQFHQFIGTPSYMSPEQAELSGLDIDTRSDIYSLGVLLYELLAGKPPFDGQALLKAGLDEMRRTLREVEPPRPSTRLAQRLRTAKRRTGEKEKRGNEAGLESASLLNSQLKSLSTDLDWIVMKCLEKDRTRRYETANGLAADLQRHLSNEPVVARPPSAAYRLQKLVRRNKLAFAAAAMVALALFVGTVVSTWQAVRATRAERNQSQLRRQAVAEKQRANEQADIARAVSEFLQQDLLRQAASEDQADRGFIAEPNLTVREALDRASQRIGDRFKDKPLVEAAIRMAIGASYNSVGDARKAVPHLERARALREARLGPEHGLTLDSMHDLALAYHHAGQREKALSLLETTVELHKRTLGPDAPGTLNSMNSLANFLMLSGQFDKSIVLIQETLARQKKKLGPTHRATLRSMHNLAIAYRELGQLDKALPLFEETLALTTESHGPNHPGTLTTLYGLAGAYRKAGQSDKAFAVLREILAKRTATLGPDHPDTLSTMYDLACAHRDARQYDLALPLFEEVLTKSRMKLGSGHTETLESMNALALAYHLARFYDKAIPLYEETLVRRREKYGPSHSKTLICMKNLGLAQQDSGQLDQAVATFQTVLDLRRSRDGSEQPETVDAMEDQVRALASRGPSEQGIALTREMLALARRLWATNAIALTKALLSAGTFLYQFGQFADAEKLLLEAQVRLPQKGAAADKLRRDALDSLARLYEKWNEQEPGSGKAEKAAEWQQKLADFDKTTVNPKTVRNRFE